MTHLASPESGHGAEGRTRDGRTAHSGQTVLGMTTFPGAVLAQKREEQMEYDTALVDLVKLLLIPLALLLVPVLMMLIFDLAAHLGELFGER